MPVQDREAPAYGLIEIHGRKVGDASRKGEILEVLGLPEDVHYRVRWEDGHESVFYPGGDTSVRTTAAIAAEPGVAEVVDVLRGWRVEFDVLPHRRTTSAEAEADVLGILPQATAKTVVARLDGQCVRAVIPASRRLSPTKLGDTLGGHPQLLTETELDGAYPAFELGAVPPFGGPAGDRVVIDRSLLEFDYVVLEAGSHDASVRLGSHDLVSVTNALVADIVNN
jgi:prolyl-tRNA editing enzyme YbaK/EbsC (Cys-tRNA(Pro) deacylase)